MSTVLITGASRGIGKQVASVLSREGWRVFAAVRKPGTAPSGTSEELLDVANPASIEALAHRLARRKVELDALVNNAGVYRAPAREVWEVNVRGPLLLTRALAPMLQRGARVVMVTSGLGSLASQSRALMKRLSEPGFSFADVEALIQEAPDGYNGSKAVLNAMTRLFARELKSRGVLVNAASPGWARTEMGGPGAPRSVEKGADSVLWAVRLGPEGPTGGVFEDGEEAGP